MEKPRASVERLNQSRIRVEKGLSDLRGALRREIGWAPTARAWVLPLMAFAAGVALALARGRRREAERSR